MTENTRRSLRDRIAQNKKPLAAALTAAGLLMVGGNAVHALWADNAQMSTTITTGTVNINIDGNEGNPTPYPITLPITQFAPGITTSKTISIKNTGTLPVTLDMVTTNSGGPTGLASALNGALTLPGNAGYSGPLSAATLTGKAIAPGATADIAIKVTAPADLANSFQGLTDTVTFGFTATQAN